MARFAGWIIAPALWLALTSSNGVPQEYSDAPVASVDFAPAPPPPPPPPPPVFVQDILGSGVVIVVSKPSQKMFVFVDGALWDSTPVSTGKPGKGTPEGTFAILQKKVFHRSNLYSNAPMPFMQRLTWTGIAMHAGHLPGYPASHGCIRMPRAFAKSLYDLTRLSSTAVIVTDEPVSSGAEGYNIALASDATVPMQERFRAERAVRMSRLDGIRTPAVPSGPTPAVTRPVAQNAPKANGASQTIQLAAATSLREAQAHWSLLVRARPELAHMRQTVVPAIVNSRQFFRLRASAPGAHAVCGNLKRAGVDCFAVI